jgi:hypothetical protein
MEKTMQIAAVIVMRVKNVFLMMDAVISLFFMIKKIS